MSMGVLPISIKPERENQQRGFLRPLDFIVGRFVGLFFTATFPAIPLTPSVRRLKFVFLVVTNFGFGKRLRLDV